MPTIQILPGEELFNPQGRHVLENGVAKKATTTTNVTINSSEDYNRVKGIVEANRVANGKDVNGQTIERPAFRDDGPSDYELTE